MSNQQPPNYNRVACRVVVFVVLAVIYMLMVNIPFIDGLPRWVYLATAIAALLYWACESYFTVFIDSKTTDSEDED